MPGIRVHVCLFSCGSRDPVSVCLCLLCLDSHTPQAPPPFAVSGRAGFSTNPFKYRTHNSAFFPFGWVKKKSSYNSLLSGARGSSGVSSTPPEVKDEENPEPWPSLSSFPICDRCDRRGGVDSGGVGRMCMCVGGKTYSREQGSSIIHKLLSALKVNTLLKAEPGRARVALKAGTSVTAQHQPARHRPLKSPESFKYSTNVNGNYEET